MVEPGAQRSPTRRWTGYMLGRSTPSPPSSRTPPRKARLLTHTAAARSPPLPATFSASSPAQRRDPADAGQETEAAKRRRTSSSRRATTRTVSCGRAQEQRMAGHLVRRRQAADADRPGDRPGIGGLVAPARPGHERHEAPAPASSHGDARAVRRQGDGEGREARGDPMSPLRGTLRAPRSWRPS